METWYKVTVLYADSLPGGKGSNLQYAFEDLVVMNWSAYPLAAMFSDHDENFETYSYYFSPQGAAIAKTLIAAYRGVSCPIPDREKVGLLVGDAARIEALWIKQSSD